MNCKVHLLFGLIMNDQFFICNIIGKHISLEPSNERESKEYAICGKLIEGEINKLKFDIENKKLIPVVEKVCNNVFEKINSSDRYHYYFYLDDININSLKQIKRKSKDDEMFRHIANNIKMYNEDLNEDTVIILLTVCSLLKDKPLVRIIFPEDLK